MSQTLSASKAKIEREVFPKNIAPRITTHVPPVLVKHDAPTRRELLRYQQNLSESYLPGVEAVGAGYNLYGEYASAKSITVQLFDWSKATKRPVSFKPNNVVPDVIDVQQQDSYRYSNSTGNSISKFQEDFTAKVTVSGAYNLFSASVSNEYSSSSLRVAENEFSRIQQSVTLWSLVLRPDFEKLRSLLYDDVRKLIDNASSDQDFETLFNLYGSHFLSGIIMGGRAVLSSATNKVQVDKSFSNETVAQASYQGFTGQLSTEARAKYSQSMSSFQQNSEMRHFVTGGDSTVASSVFSGVKADFDKWVATVGTSPDFIDFMSNNPLTGLWVLCVDSTNRANMQRYFTEVWGPRKSREAQIYANYIDALAVVYGGSSEVPPPAGYTKIPYDLNRGAGGQYIYLCYHKMSVNPMHLQDQPACITDILFVKGKGAPAPSGYTKIDVDLNKGAGGEYIYLCYKSIAYNPMESIKGITIVGGGNPDIPPPYDFTKVPQDLNQGAGGDYIYLCYSKTA